MAPRGPLVVFFAAAFVTACDGASVVGGPRDASSRETGLYADVSAARDAIPSATPRGPARPADRSATAAAEGACPASAASGACAPRSCTDLSSGCGYVADGCAGLLQCGMCPADQACGFNGVANRCGAPG